MPKRTGKVNVVIPRDTYNRLKELIPSGFKKKIFMSFIEELIPFLEQQGTAGVVALCDGIIGLGYDNRVDLTPEVRKLGPIETEESLLHPAEETNND